MLLLFSCLPFASKGSATQFSVYFSYSLFFFGLSMHSSSAAHLRMLAAAYAVLLSSHVGERVSAWTHVFSFSFFGRRVYKYIYLFI